MLQRWLIAFVRNTFTTSDKERLGALAVLTSVCISVDWNCTLWQKVQKPLSARMCHQCVMCMGMVCMGFAWGWFWPPFKDGASLGKTWQQWCVSWQNLATMVKKKMVRKAKSPQRCYFVTVQLLLDWYVRLDFLTFAQSHNVLWFTALRKHGTKTGHRLPLRKT